MNEIDDRRRRVDDEPGLYGIDFVEVDVSDPTLLRVHFFDQDVTDFPIDVEAVEIVAVDPDARPNRIDVLDTTWVDSSGVPVLELRVERTGDFTDYLVILDHDAVDLAYDRSVFSFQVVCDREVDCRKPTDPYELVKVDFPVDYRGRDYRGLRQSLLDFLERRYPDWGDAVPADQVVMFAEVLASIGDDFAIYQDHIAEEGRLETASQRRSLDFLARLVDYRWSPSQTASGFLAFEVAGSDVPVIAGTVARKIRPKADPAAPGVDGIIPFEIAEQPEDILGGRTFLLNESWNAIDPYVWDADERPILPRGSTSIDIDGDMVDTWAGSTTGAGPFDVEGWILLEVSHELPERRQNVIVKLRAAERLFDELTDRWVTRLHWDEAEGLSRPIDMRNLAIRGNVLPILAGWSRQATFIVSDRWELDVDPAVLRPGPNGSTVIRLALNEVADTGLGFSDGEPHLRIRSAPYDGSDLDAFVSSDPWDVEWEYDWSLLYGRASSPGAPVFTLDRGSFAPIASWWEGGEKVEFVDYAFDEGWTIRFGEGEFGRKPDDGTLFDCWWRTDPGIEANVAASAIDEVVAPNKSPFGAFDEVAHDDINRVWNPVPLTNGRPEPAREEVVRDAPRAFREEVHRAVRPEDYAHQAEKLSVVSRAGARFRWTGSWTTAFVTPDAVGGTFVDDVTSSSVRDQMERVRQVGRPVRVESPEYVDLDLRIVVCLEDGTSETTTRRKLERRLLGDRDVRGFFAPDNWTFGDPLRRDVLEAVIESVRGIRAVESIEIRRRGYFDWRRFVGLAFELGPREVLRVQNDPLFPRRGSVEWKLNGGR